MKKSISIISAVFAIALGVVCVGTTQNVNAAVDIQLSQTITPGVLSVSVLDASEATVTSPAVGMSTLATATTCRPTGSTGTLGTNAQRLYVDNPGAADNGWSLSIAATGGATATWSSGSDTYDFNDQTSLGCADGADADTGAGLLSVNPSTSVVTPACSGICTTSGVTTGVNSSFDQGATDSIELVNAGAASDNMWRGYVTGIGLTQSIPAAQVSGSYAINMTATVVAL